MKINTLFRDRYFLADTLGCGGMGVVYLAFDIKSCQFVAIKSLFAELASISEYRQRFLREHRIYQGLSHPHIVRYIDGDTDAARPWVALEFVSGRALKSFIKGPNTRLPLLRTLRYLVALASALHAAHLKEVVHRDVKPTNLIIDQDQNIKLIDFGVADANDSLVRTESGIVLGTRCYASPEQNRGHCVDGRADIYSLGVTVWELLTGQVLFRATTVFGVVSAQIAKSFLPPSTYNEEIPKDLDELVLSMLEPSPSNRPKSAADVAQKAERIRLHLLREMAASKDEYQFDEYQKALELVCAGKEREAETILTNMDGSLDYAPAQFLLGKIAWQQKLKFQALEKVRRAITLDDDNILYKVDLARLLLSFRMHNQARSFIGEALSENKDKTLLAALDRLLRIGRAYISVEAVEEKSSDEPRDEVQQHRWSEPTREDLLGQTLEETHQALALYRESVANCVGFVDFQGYARPGSGGFPTLELSANFPRVKLDREVGSLSNILQTNEKVILFGPSGCGLTSLLRGFAYKRVSSLKENRLPIIVSIPEYIQKLKEYPDCTLEAFAIQEAAGFVSNVSIALWRQLRTGQLLWLLDDMVGEEHSAFEHICHQMTGLMGTCVVATHQVAEDWSYLPSYLPCEVLPYDDEERRQYIKLWCAAFGKEAMADDLASHIEELPNLHAVLNRPLELAIACQATLLYEPRDYPRTLTTFLDCHLARHCVDKGVKSQTLWQVTEGPEVLPQEELQGWIENGVLRDGTLAFRHTIVRDYARAKMLLHHINEKGIEAVLERMRPLRHLPLWRRAWLLAGPILDERDAIALFQDIIYSSSPYEGVLRRNVRFAADLASAGAPVEKALLSRLVKQVATIVKGQSLSRYVLGLLLIAAIVVLLQSLPYGQYVSYLLLLSLVLAYFTSLLLPLRRLYTLPGRLWFVWPVTEPFVAAAAHLGERAKDCLLSAMKNSSSPGSQCIAAQNTRSVAGEEITTALLALMEDEEAEPTVRVEAAKALGHRKLCVEELNRMFKVVRTLSAAEEVRAACANTMVQVGGTDAIQNVLEGLIHQAHSVRTITAAASAFVPPRQDVLDVLAQLVDDRYPDVRLATVKTLGVIGGEQALAPLVKAIGDHNEGVRLEARKRLIEQNDKAIKPLLDIAKNGELEKEVRADAVACLAEIKCELVTDHLIELSENENHHIRSAAILGMGRTQKKPSIEVVVKALEDYRDEVRKEAATTLSVYPGENAYEPLVRALKDNNRDVRRAAISSLLKMGVVSVNDTLLRTLDDKDWEVRRDSTLALGRLFDSSVVPHLIKVLEDKIKGVQLAAIESLKKIGDVRAIEPLMELLIHSDGEIIWAAGTAVASFGEMVPIDELGALLGARDVATRSNAILALGATRKREAVAYLERALDDPASDVRCAAVEALAPIVGKESLELLVKALTDQKGKVRFSAVAALGLWGKNPIAVDGLIGMLRDEDVKVRSAAAKWLGRCQAKQAYTFVLPLLDDLEQEVRLAAVEALGALGGSEAIEALIPILGSWQLEMREEAIKAIGHLCHRERNTRVLQRAAQALWWTLTDEKRVAQRSFQCLERIVLKLEEVRS